jgi:hypothetical protein
MLNREDWLPLARKVDWQFAYTTEQEVSSADAPGFPTPSWQDWKRPSRPPTANTFRTSTKRT